VKIIRLREDIFLAKAQRRKVSQRNPSGRRSFCTGSRRRETCAYYISISAKEFSDKLAAATALEDEHLTFFGPPCNLLSIHRY
jgi:hypothetical protein